MKTQIENRQFDAERALYHLQDASVKNCVFAGPADGESVLKEGRRLAVEDCRFSLRYPMWHVKGFTLARSRMDEWTRAALWYSDDGEITDCDLGGIKAVRECNRIRLSHCRVNSKEFGWKSDGIVLEDTDIVSEYLFLDSKNVRLDRVNMKGKYSFQYMENLAITDSVLDTKDAFWHSRNVTVRNSVVKGEYLGWFSDGLTLVNCRIQGTQPLCYCKNLTLIDCTMEDCDLSFEYSEVSAEIIGSIDSVKNPKAGRIVADRIGEILWEDAIMDCHAEELLRTQEEV